MADPPSPETGNVVSRLEQLAEEAERAVLEAATPEQVEELRVRYLGRKAELTTVLRSIAGLPQEQRAEVGRGGHPAAQAVESLIDERSRELDSRRVEQSLRGDRLDVTLPGEPPVPVGPLPPITQNRPEPRGIFRG